MNAITLVLYAYASAGILSVLAMCVETLCDGRRLRSLIWQHVPAAHRCWPWPFCCRETPRH